MAKLRRIHGLHRGKIIRVTIESLAPGGAGVGHSDGVAIFVDRTAPGDIVDVELFDVRKSFARGKVIELIEASRMRANPSCAVFDRCGGCQWQHIDYAAQLKAKHDIVTQALRNIDDVEIEAPLASINILRYRNKAQFPVKQSKRGRLLIGYFEDNSHRVVDLNECPVQPKLMDKVIQSLRPLLEKHNIDAYDEVSHSGLLRHICARQSFHNDEILVTLVLNSASKNAVNREDGKALETIGNELMTAVPEVKGVCLNFNTMKGNKIFGEETECLVGVSEIEEVLQSERTDRPQRLKDGIRFRLSTQSFFQINSEQAARLFDLVYDRAAIVRDRLDKPLRMIDAYAGVGTIAMWVANLAEEVVAIEESPDAVKDGKSTIELNQVDNIVFEEGRSEDVLSRMANAGFSTDLVILDPPRKGCAPEVLEALLKLLPESVIYVSCNPQTLARDLKILQDGVVENRDGKQVRSGYKTIQVKPVDLFPQTYHVESIATLERFTDDGPFGNLEKV